VLHEFLSANRVAILERARAKVATRPAPTATKEELANGIPLGARRADCLSRRELQRPRLQVDLAVRSGLISADGVSSGCPGRTPLAERAIEDCEESRPVVRGSLQEEVKHPQTLQAKTAMTGLTVGTVYYFRVQGLTMSGAGDWSLPTALLVK
jgi:hypothetical protein